MAQIVLRQRRFRIVQLKDNPLPQGEIIAKEYKFTTNFEKIFSRISKPISIKLGTNHS
jgi:hypothetical protein